MIEVRKLSIDPSKRSIIISDIHANIHTLKQLLNKLNVTESDYLFINGDMCEKGPDSLAVVRYLYERSKQQNVFITKGNCDVLQRYVFEENEFIVSYMEKQKYSILHNMLQEQGKNLEDFPNLSALGEFYHIHYHKELQWLESLPVAYETEQFIVVHAGLEEKKQWWETDEMQALSIPSFYEKKHLADKFVCVGHWPVVNYRANSATSNNPIIDYDKKIIAMDGGNQIKRDGQLNAVIIQNDTVTHTYVDALRNQTVSKKRYIDISNAVGTVIWPDYDMQPVRKGTYFTLCNNQHWNEPRWVKNEYLVEQGDHVVCRNDISTTFLSIEEAEQVSIIDSSCAGYILVKKKDGAVGWLPKDCFE